MASEVDIANLALAHLGDDATVTSFDPPDGSAQAEHCARFYPIARDLCLEAGAWKFAKRTVQIDSPLDETVDGWTYAYAVPSDAIKVLSLYAEGSRRRTDAEPAEFEIETDDEGQSILLTDVENPYLVYIRPVTDTSKYSASFVTALSYLLAAMIAGPLLKGDSGEKASGYWMQVWRAFIGTAAVLDAGKQRLRFDPVPGPILARR